MDSTVGITASIQEAARDLGLAVPDRERASHVIGLGLLEALRTAVPELPPQRYAEFAEAYRRHFRTRQDDMALFPGVREMLEELRARGHRLAVATGKSRRGLEHQFGVTGLGSLFAASRCADETSPKPHPAMLNELMRELAMQRHELVMIGDTSHDLGMAQSAGVDAVAVGYGAHRLDALSAWNPRASVSSVPELREWLSRNA